MIQIMKVKYVSMRINTHLPHEICVTTFPMSSNTFRGLISWFVELCPSCPYPPAPNVNTPPSCETRPTQHTGNTHFTSFGPNLLAEQQHSEIAVSATVSQPKACGFDSQLLYKRPLFCWVGSSVCVRFLWMLHFPTASKSIEVGYSRYHRRRTSSKYFLISAWL